MNECELCKSQWGNYWKVIKDRNLFFCCQLCALQYENLVNAIKNKISGQHESIIEIHGTSRLRTCIVLKKDKKYRFSVSYGTDGQIFHFKEL